MKHLRIPNIFLTAMAIAAMCIATPSLQAANISHPDKSALATGKWVKISVPADGICQISYDKLRQWGFSNPSKVKVYGAGAHALQHNMFLSGEDTDIYPTHFEHTADNRIVFYGASTFPIIKSKASANRFRIDTALSHYCNNSYYFLTDYDDRFAQPATPLEYVASPNDKLLTHTHIEFEDNDNFNYAQGGTVYHDRLLNSGDNLSVTFPVRDFAGSKETPACVTMLIAGWSDQKPYDNTILIKMPEGTTSLSYRELNFTNPTLSSPTYHYSIGQAYNMFIGKTIDSPLTDGKYSFNISFPKSYNFSYLAYDRAHLHYQRNNIVRPDEPWLVMNFPYTNALQTFGVTGLTMDNARIWDVTNTTDVRPYQIIYRTETATAEATFQYTYNVDYPRETVAIKTKAARVIAFNIDNQFPEANFVTEISNQNIHGMETPDMVIVTTDQLLPQAQELADLHARVDGIVTHVFTQQQVFNEFSYGNAAAMGIRRMCKMFYDRSIANPAGRQFKYLLMYGPESYDNRDIEVQTDFEKLISYHVDDTYADAAAPYDKHNNYCSDMYFAFLDNDFDPKYNYKFIPQIAVGRIPATSTADAAIANKKIADYVSNMPSAYFFTHALSFSDDGDANRHLIQAVEAANTLRQNTPITVHQPHDSFFNRPNRTNPLATERLLNALQHGVGFMNYCGHGDARSFTAEAIYSLGIIGNNTYNTLPYAHLSTCYSLTMDRHMRHIGEAMFFKPNGGAIAVTGAGRSVFMEYNQYLNLGIADAYANATPGTTVGDIWLKGNLAVMKPVTESSRADARNIFANTLCYNLCGDPALKLPFPTQNSVFINKINDTTVSLPIDNDSTYVSVDQLQPVTFTGFVAKPGTTEVDTDFNGILRLEIFEAPHNVPVVINDSNDLPATFNLDETLLADAVVNVVNGVFSASTLMPMAYSEEPQCRILMSAVNNNNANDSRAGFSNALGLSTDNIYDYNPDNITLPQITGMAIDGYSDNTDIPHNFTLTAKIEPGDGGLSNGNTMLAPGIKLVVDHNSTVKYAPNYMAINADGSADLNVPIYDIADGAHTITLSVSDKLGNTVQQDMSVMVRNNATKASLVADCNIVRNTVELSILSSAADNNTSQSRLIITDADGNTVLSVTNPAFPFSWNLLDSNEKPVSDGQYNAVCILKAGSAFCATPKLPLTVIKSAQ